MLFVHSISSRRGLAPTAALTSGLLHGHSRFGHRSVVRLLVTVSVMILVPQQIIYPFLFENNPVAHIQVNESNANAAGRSYSTTAALTSGSMEPLDSRLGCASAVRLLVSV
jgi:hypothetical protein